MWTIRTSKVDMIISEIQRLGIEMESCERGRFRCYHKHFGFNTVARNHSRQPTILGASFLCGISSLKNPDSSCDLHSRSNQGYPLALIISMLDPEAKVASETLIRISLTNSVLNPIFDHIWQFAYLTTSVLVLERNRRSNLVSDQWSRDVV